MDIIKNISDTLNQQQKIFTKISHLKYFNSHWTPKIFLHPFDT